MSGMCSPCKLNEHERCSGRIQTEIFRKGLKVGTHDGACGCYCKAPDGWRGTPQPLPRSRWS
jgi:hypothetical protein